MQLVQIDTPANHEVYPNKSFVQNVKKKQVCQKNTKFRKKNTPSINRICTCVATIINSPFCYPFFFPFSPYVEYIMSLLNSIF